MATYPPGSYIFTLTGKIGDQTTYATFNLMFQNPCVFTTVTIIKPSTFGDGEYILRDPSFGYAWDLTTIATIDTQVDCGSFDVAFRQDGQNILVGSTIFADNRSPDSFTILYSEDINNVQVYEIIYIVYLALYPTTYSISDASQLFQIELRDPCKAPLVSITATPSPDVYYTLFELAESQDISL